MSSITEVLILRGLMPVEALRPGASPQDEERLVRDLVAQGVLTPAQLASARAAQAGLPFVELLDFPVDPNAVALVPAGLARRYDLLPLQFVGDSLLVAMADPGNVVAVDDVRSVAKRPVRLAVAEQTDLRHAIDRLYRADTELSSLSTEIQEQQAGAQSPIDEEEASEDDAPIVRFVNLIIAQAIQDKASDIHLEPGEHELLVRYRIDGVLHEMQRAPKNIQNGVTSRLKIMAELDIAERRRPQDGRITVQHHGNRADLRVAVLPTVWGEKIVLRILDTSTTKRDIQELGMTPHNLERYQRNFSKPYGMIVVCGPTGSGKSTTLYTTLDTVARPEINVITVEDPVERRIPGINQVQVNVKAGLTFAGALRSILRSDPDVVLIGEIRDGETARIATEAALTGHLVLSTLHTNDAPSAVTRLIEMEIEPFLVGSALDCVVAQRLARRLCERCKEQFQPSAEELTAMRFPVPEGDLPMLYRPVGCASCSNTGYRGRLALHEVMEVDEDIERLAVARASSAEIEKVALAHGMIPLRQDGWIKAQMGLTSIEEVMRVVA
ncbi:MAG TPA: ATPase, T2SS/T4P/T4SS family [Microbacteriaceae bacterium]|nr:ATPase, T2SS/T4P/T4SS family [Microbacteriaceae bacterium]